MKLKVTETFEETYNAYHSGKYRQIVSMGGSRSSKSYSILQLLMIELIKRRNIKITVWRDTKVTCRSTVLEDFKKIIMFDKNINKKFKENKQSGSFTYKPTNSKIIFEGADDIGKVLGSAQDISFFNEVTEFSKDVYLQITQRTSDKVICDYNPSKDFWLENYRLDERTVFLHSNFQKNSFCPPEIVIQLLSYEPWESGSYEVVGSDVYYKGKVISSKNQPPLNKENVRKGTADVYMWLVYGLGLGSEKPNKIYKGWKNISQIKFDNLPYESYFGIDFGSSNPTAIVEVKYDGDGIFYVSPRFYRPLKDIEASVTSALKIHVPSYSKGDSLIVGDSAKQAYIDSMKLEGHFIDKAIKGSGSVESGITNMQSLNIYYVTNKEFKAEYDKYSYETDRYNKPTDKPIKKEDHYMDATRYIITYLIRYLDIKI